MQSTYLLAHPQPLSRRHILLSVGPLALPAQLLKQLQGEAGLWRQEVDMYKRQAGQYVQVRSAGAE